MAEASVLGGVYSPEANRKKEAGDGHYYSVFEQGSLKTKN